MTSRERLMVAFHCGVPDRVPVAPQGFGRVPRDSPLGRELVTKTDIIVYAGGGVNPFSCPELDCGYLKMIAGLLSFCETGEPSLVNE